MKNYERKLFKIFTEEKEELIKYKKIMELLTETKHEAEKETDIKHYNNYVELSSSINNAGHEERRSDDISKLAKFKDEISDRYPEDN